MTKEQAQPKLTIKQETFVAEYLVDLNATQAAIRAGYSAKTANEQGSRLLANVSVQKLIQERMSQRAERLEITSDYVLNTIVDTIERCRQAKPVLDKAGKPVLVFNENEQTIVPMYAFDPSAVLKGSELLGKHLKLFTDKTEVTGKD
ncbi:MAG: hypothetical protein B7X61_15770 [Gallionellales bacterium 39-52-133]|nr:MAG: hypothetical protein B7X61_15770 [Gallionellales bacterium 39-52-133]